MIFFFKKESVPTQATSQDSGLKIWLPKEQHQQHLDIYWECKFSGSIPDLLKEQPRVGLAIYVETSLPGHSDIHTVLEPWTRQLN